MATALKESLSEDNDIVLLNDTGISVLRSAVIYGANASGKSNVLKALSFYKSFITDSFKNNQAGENIKVESFHLNATTINEPTTMECSFTDGEFIYRYGFEVTPKEVKAEWLYQRACKKRAKEVEIYYRENKTTIVHSKSILIQEIVNKKMVRNNALLLSTIAQFNEPKAVKIMHWLSDTQVLFCTEDDKLWEQAIRHLDNETMCRRTSELKELPKLTINLSVSTSSLMMKERKPITFLSSLARMNRKVLSNTSLCLFPSLMLWITVNG